MTDTTTGRVRVTGKAWARPPGADDASHQDPATTAEASPGSGRQIDPSPVDERHDEGGDR